MIRVTVIIPGVAKPFVVTALTEQDGVAYALYSLGMSALPEGSLISSEPVGDTPCFSAT